MDGELLKTLFLPLALFVIMFGMGMTLTPRDFARVVRRPKAKLLGLFSQLALIPLTALALIALFGLQGELAVGLLLVAACPGGPTSNIISHLSKGDTALSVTLTAISSVVTVFTIPLVVGAGLGYFLQSDHNISLGFLQTVLQLTVVTILPISLGMLLHAKRPALTGKLTRPFNILSLVFLALVILAAVTREENLAGQFRAAGPAAVSLNLLTMAIGHGMGALGKLPARQRVTLSIECGIQNGTLALGIALGILDRPTLAIPAVVYSLWMFVSGAAVIFWQNRPLGKKT